MLDYLIPLIGLSLLCAGWVVFQLWLKRVDPDRNNYQPGCGGCKGGACGTPTPHASETSITPDAIRKRGPLA